MPEKYPNRHPPLVNNLIVLWLLCQGESYLHALGRLVRRGHEYPFADGFLRGVGKDFASGDGFGVDDFSIGIDNGLDHNSAFDLQVPGEVGVLGGDAGLDGAVAGSGRMQGEGGEEDERGDPEQARGGALDSSDGETERADQHWFSPGAKVA